MNLKMNLTIIASSNLSFRLMPSYVIFTQWEALAGVCSMSSRSPFRLFSRNGPILVLRLLFWPTLPVREAH